MKDLKPRKGALYLQRLIAEGEHEHQDFKYSVSDARKIARSISAFANNGGGRLLIGVKDNGVIAGVRNEEDLYVVETAAAIYCRPSQQIEFAAYRADGGEVVFIAEIAESHDKPVSVAEADGTLRAYYRVKDENIAASALMVESWSSQRQTETSVLRLTEAETTLLRRIEACDTVTLDDYMKLAHCSRRMMEMSVSRLLAMGIVRMVYDGHQWVLSKQ
ncbi:MAG: ATP-binding protein [Muribaculaceae bacterium]|mgnify:CR=1 FL=1|nr:ATP-binding protein [Muribaculaceae bacterium]